MSRFTMVLISACMALLLTGCGQGAAPGNAESAPETAEAASETAAEAKLAAETKAPPISIDIGDATADAAPAAQSPVPDVVAKVGDAEILREDYEEYLTYKKRMAMAHGQPELSADELAREAVEDLVDRQVLTNLAADTVKAVTDEEIDEALEQKKSQFPNPDMFESTLERMGMTEADLKTMLREQIGVMEYIRKQTEDLEASADELQEAYKTMAEQGELDRPETVDVAHILVKVDDEGEEAWTEGKKAIDAARKRVEDGEEFAEVAKDVSDDPGSAQRGGAYMGTPRGKMVPEFEEQMFSLPVGGLSEPFKTDYGWHILTVLGKHEAGTQSYEDAEEDVKDSVIREKRTELFEQLIDAARGKMPIEIFYPEAAEAEAETANEADAGEAEAETADEADAAEAEAEAADDETP